MKTSQLISFLYYLKVLIHHIFICIDFLMSILFSTFMLIIIFHAMNLALITIQINLNYGGFYKKNVSMSKWILQIIIYLRIESLRNNLLLLYFNKIDVRKFEAEDYLQQFNKSLHIIRKINIAMNIYILILFWSFKD